jgi:hypothetical protein
MALSGIILAAAAAVQAAPSPICTDRPAKANAICTVPAGMMQLETNAAGWALAKADGKRSELSTIGSSFVKLGLSDRSDLQVGFTPYTRLAVTQGSSREHVSGFGDVVVRYKHRLTSDSAKVQVGVIPFVKLPTARRGLGNDKVEGGLAVPMSIMSGGPAIVTLGPELDMLADGDGNGYHFALVNLVNLGLPVFDRLTVAGELWTNFNFDPAETLEQASADAALAYAVSNSFQVDFGANLGLTHDTPDVELYAGASLRF